MSDIGKVAAALARAQQNMGKALKQSNNPHFRSKYADLGNVIDACLSALNDEGIAVVQPSGREGDMDYVDTILIHGESGQSLSCRVPLLLGKKDMQGYGSAVTYSRRYGLMMMTGIAPEDDDGNAAAANPPAQNKPNAAQNVSQGVKDAWQAAVLDNLPENASSRDKAAAFAEAIIAELSAPKSADGVEGIWRKREKIINSLHEKHDDLYQSVLDAYDTRMKQFDGQA